MTTKFDPTKPVQTRDGRKARIICTDKVGAQPIVALITNANGNEGICSFNANGCFWPGEIASLNDLINIPEPKKLRPWRPEEVPVGARIKSCWLNTIIAWCEKVSGVYQIGALDCTPEGRRWNLHEFHRFSDIKHSIDGGKTWLPCGVEE